MSPISEFPEYRPLDIHGCPVWTPFEIEQAKILQNTIARENAEYERGGPCAGHDWQKEHNERTGRGR